MALVVLLGIALLEGISTLFGAALSSVIDTMLPGIPSGPEATLSSGIEAADADTPFALSRFFSWLRVGEVPVLMLVVIFLTAFSLIGLGLQSLTEQAIGRLLPGWLASVPTLALSLPTLRFFGGLLKRYLPHDETEAVTLSSLTGRIATITIGTATPGRPAEARVSDGYGTTHLLMVEPDEPLGSFSAGDKVLLVKQEGAVFKVIANPNSLLTD